MSGAQALAALITESRLKALAGGKSFERGAAYYAGGAVAELVDTGRAVNARVLGTDEYRVTLRADGKTLAYACTCPVGEDGDFCKHAVAAGLAWLEARAGNADASAYTVRSELDTMRDYLAAESKERLVDILMEQVENDSALRSRLQAEVARARHPADLPTLKETVRKAFAVSGFVDYHGMRGLLQRAHPAVELIAGLIEDGHAPTALDLAHYAVKRGIATYERIDDSGGGFGDLLRQLAELHLKACRAAPPEPIAFGKTVFDLMLRDQWGLLVFDDYAPLLGEAGLNAFRALADKTWKKVPTRGPGADDTRAYGEYFQITRIMETLAHHADDVDALVAIKSRDLTSQYRFLEIAEILAEASRRDVALDWAERGRKTFPDRPDSRLVEFLADEYGRRSRHDDAIALTWEQFRQQPALRSYQRLKTCAGRAGAWDEWRAKALASLREDFRNAEKRDRSRWSWMPGGHSLLVDIFLWEGDSDAALTEAKVGGCAENLWFELAKAREKNHPQDAVEIYQKHLDGIVHQANNRAYDEAAALVGKIRDLMRRAKQESEFATWLETVRARHKAKRNFMQRLDKAVHER